MSSNSRAWSQGSGLGWVGTSTRDGRIEEHQHVLLDPDADRHLANDFRSDVIPAAEADLAVL